MSDRFLNTVSSFDLITPLVAYLQDFFNGPTAHFGIPPLWSRRDIRRLLTGHGIKVWGLMLSPKADTLMFAVRRSQAWWTREVLQREGIPILYAPDEAFGSSTNKKGSRPLRPKSRKKANSKNVIEQLFDFLDKVDESLS